LNASQITPLTGSTSCSPGTSVAITAGGRGSQGGLKANATRSETNSMTQVQQTNQWPHITALLDQQGGHISIGRMPPIEGAVIAVNDQTLIASLVPREGEAFPQLLQRLTIDLPGFLIPRFWQAP
jgi:hypothetical protein